ncbi:hypothetical protein BJF91_07440 [Allorhizobium taibaishanense]|uniref:Uncharacterized protein n=1 Tax=Allorhizobium taibaishanense TaxID=887144 RepID=A0A1Q9A8W9_9HYPH|nr:hypothetical protein BJF91_07440 [Allorhizobium taibaishanense]
MISFIWAVNGRFLFEHLRAWAVREGDLQFPACSLVRLITDIRHSFQADRLLRLSNLFFVGFCRKQVQLCDQCFGKIR